MKAFQLVCSYIICHCLVLTEGLPGEISCAGCGKSIHWKNEHVHQHKRLNVLICQVRTTLLQLVVTLVVCGTFVTSVVLLVALWLLVMVILYP